MTSVTDSAPVLAPKCMFGLRTDIKGNAQFISEDEVIYPVGGNMVCHNHLLKRQRFIKIPDTKKIIQELIIAPNRRWLALKEVSQESGALPSTTIYDLTSFKRRRCLTVPPVEELKNPTATEFSCLQFTFDSKYLIAITGEPDWWLYQFNWDRGKCESSASGRAHDSEGTVDIVQCNPADATLIVVGGRNTFRIMNVQEAVWNQWGWNAADKLIITALMWLTPDRIFFGTEDQQIMMVENGELRPHCIFDAMTVELMSLRKTGDMDIPEEEDAAGKDAEAVQEEEEEEKFPVRFFINFSAGTEGFLSSEQTVGQAGFVFCCGPGKVHYFKKETPHHYIRQNVFKMCKLSYKHTREYPMFSELDEILHMTITPAELVLLVTTHRAQLFTVKINGPPISQVPEIPFNELGPAMHYGRIKSLSLCAWKPIFMTSGEDKSIRVWNYLKEDIEMVKIYQEEIQCVSLHPTGLFAIVGFSDKLRFMVVLIDDFEVMREFPVRNCMRAKFSTNGHLFAAVNGQVIQVFSSVSFQNIHNLKGHNGLITGISWSANDLVLTSCGVEGAVYEWGMGTGQRIGEIIFKTHKFYGCAVNSVGKLTYAAGSDGVISQVANNAIEKSLKLLDGLIVSIILSRSDLMLFATGTGGLIKTLQLPISDKQNFTNEFLMHNKAVTCLALSYDDVTLISVGEDASICLWQVMNPEGRAIQLDVDFGYAKEILISRKDLQDKINNINLLSTRMSELETEHNYQLRQSEATHCEKLKQIHDGYCATIEELKSNNEVLENENNHQIGCIQQDIAKLKASHERALQEMEAEFNIRLINEYDRYQHLENKAARMRNEFEERLASLADSKRLAMRDLNFIYEGRLEDKEMALLELQEEADLGKREHETMTVSIEDDADKEILDIKAAYATQLKEEKDANVRLKGEIGLMKKKLITASKEIDEFKHTIHQLKAEHRQFQKVIATLEREVTDIKKDIQERDETIKEKEKRIYELKRKRSELEKYKFVLNFRITELKNQIEPLERKIKESKLRVLELEESLENLLKARAYRDEKILMLQEKMKEAKADVQRESDKCMMMKGALKKIKIDFHDMTGDFQDPVKLKHCIKELFHKWVEDIDFLRNREAEIDAIHEFCRQRKFLQQQIRMYRIQLNEALTISKGNIYKIMDENYALLEEMNVLRAELNAARARCFQMQSILGLSARYVPPDHAHSTLNYVTEDRAKLYDKYKDQFVKKHEVVLGLKEENARLTSKFPSSKEKRSALLNRKSAAVAYLKRPKHTASEGGMSSGASTGSGGAGGDTPK